MTPEEARLKLHERILQEIKWYEEATGERVIKVALHLSEKTGGVKVFDIEAKKSSPG
jgi:hypothetical protein